MLKTRIFLLGIALILGACQEVLSIPTISLSSDASLMAFLQESDEGNSLSLQILNLSTGETSELGNPDTMKGAFDWHPSEARLAYVELEDESRILIQASDSSGESQQLMSLSDNSWVNQIAYSPDARYLALSVSVLPLGTDMHHLLDFTEDLNPSEIRVAIVEIATGFVQEVASDTAGDSPSLEWSPDGTQLAYAYDGHVFVYNLAEAKSSEITWDEHLSLRSPAWISSTSLMMLSALDPEGEGPEETTIVIYHLDTNEREEWTVEANAAVPSPSPDGRFAAYLTGRPATDSEESNRGYATAIVTVMLLDLEQGTTQPLYVGISLDRPVWSPDGERLYISNGNAFSMSLDDQREIFALDVATGETSPIYEGAIATSSLVGWFPPQEESGQ